MEEIYCKTQINCIDFLNVLKIFSFIRDTKFEYDLSNYMLVLC